MNTSSVSDSFKLFIEPGSLTEVRVLLRSNENEDERICRNQFYFGREAESLAKDLDQFEKNPDCIGCYFVINPVRPELYANNKIKWRPPFQTRVESSKSEDIICRKWLLIDCDSIRSADSSATNNERSYSVSLAGDIINSLSLLGFASPILGDSGNGVHIYYPIDLPNNEAITAQIKEFLHELSIRFSNKGAKVDPVTFDGQRMGRVYGTIARKGESTPERPWRKTGIISSGQFNQDTRKKNNEAILSALTIWRAQYHEPGESKSNLDLARLYLEKVDGAVSGSGGSIVTFRVACTLQEGFALNHDDAYSVISEWNERCVPPWTEQDLRKKLRDAANKIDQSKIGHLVRNNDQSFLKTVVLPKEESAGKTDATVADLIRLGQSLQWIWPGWIQRGAIVGLAAQPGAGKCFSRGTRILMYDGSVKNVENIVVGDMVMGPDSKPRLVGNLANGIEEMYKVTHTNGMSYTVNKSHILSLKMSNHHNYKHHEVVNITVSDYLNSSQSFKNRAKGWTTGVEFNSRPIRVPPYILGIWLGDGEAKTTTIHSPDDEICDAILSYCQESGLKFRIADVESSCKRICITSRCGRFGNTFLNGLRTYGLCPDKFVPEDFILNSMSVRLEILAGLLDTDGHMTHGGFEFSNKSKQIAESVCFIARSVGLRSKICSRIKKCQTGASGEYFIVSISGDCSVIPTRIKRKIAHKRRQIKDPSVYGIKVEPAGVGEYYGFEIIHSSDSLFLLDNFIVVHNSRTCADFAKRIYKGMPWPDGTERTLEPGSKVLWLACDNQWGEIAVFPEQFGIPPEAIYLNAWGDDPTTGTVLDSIKDFKGLEERITRTGVALTFIDTVMNSTTHNTMRPEDGIRFFKPLAEVAQRTNTAIILVTHLSANNEALGRRIVGQCRQMINLEKFPDDPNDSPKRRMFVSKSNSVIPKELIVTLKGDGADYSVVGQVASPKPLPPKPKVSVLEEARRAGGIHMDLAIYLARFAGYSEEEIQGDSHGSR